ncbi:MAG: hypothetical protein ACP5PO_03360 [Desulfurella sp.]|uniref:hypothetical protein n=1 Tax=Desulfurella sp. TaxID=1962857 RepID=UPI003D13B985
MAQLRKNFYITEETFNQFEQLKQKYGIIGESETFIKIVKEAIEFDELLKKLLKIVDKKIKSYKEKLKRF